MRRHAVVTNPWESDLVSVIVSKYLASIAGQKPGGDSEIFRILTILIHRQRRRYSNRLRAGMLVLGCLVAHPIEVVMFGLAFWILDSSSQGAGLDGLVLVFSHAAVLED